MEKRGGCDKCGKIVNKYYSKDEQKEWKKKTKEATRID